MHPLRRVIWGHIWKNTVEKRQANAACVILRALIQVLCGDMWKDTLDKSQTNATCVILHPIRQVIWGDIWKHTVEKSQTNATCVQKCAKLCKIVQNVQNWAKCAKLCKIIHCYSFLTIVVHCCYPLWISKTACRWRCHWNFLILLRMFWLNHSCVLRQFWDKINYWWCFPMFSMQSKTHTSYLSWRKICHVEKFQISVDDRCGEI